MFLKAAFKFKNVMILAAGAFLTAAASTYAPLVPWLPYLVGAVGAGAYAAGIAGTIKSSKFREELELSEALDGIGRLDWECNSLYRRIWGRLGKNHRIKAMRIMKQKEELMRYFNRHCDDPIRQRIIEQALKLVMAYFNLAANLCDRVRDLSRQNLNELVSRINENNRRLGSLKNYQAVLELTKTIEMDEKLLESLKEEREHLEMVNVRLEQIESAIVGFKHRIMSSELSDPETEEIENTVNEAVALDNALNERNRLRRRI